MRKVVARWESRGGKDWAELQYDESGYWHQGRGCGGFIGSTLEYAMSVMESRVQEGAYFYCSQKSAMKRVGVSE